MLSQNELEPIARQIQEQLFEAHRGAIATGNGPLIVAFWNDGGRESPKGDLGISRTKTVLAVDGFRVGPEAATEDGYTVVVAVEPPAALDVLEATERVSDAVWEGWRSVRDLPTQGDPFADLQEMLARSRTVDVRVSDLI